MSNKGKDMGHRLSVIPRGANPRSGQDRLDDLAALVGQADVEAAEAVGQPEVVEAEEGGEGGVEVVAVDRALGAPPAELVGGANGPAARAAAAGQPDAERQAVVVAPGPGARLGVLGDRRPAELGAP